MDYTLFDGIALGDVLSEGTPPKPFRLFRIGENSLTQNGKDYKLTLSAEDLRAIAGYNTKKGEKKKINTTTEIALRRQTIGQ